MPSPVFRARVVMEPESGAMVACHGLANAAKWIDMTA